MTRCGTPAWTGAYPGPNMLWLTLLTLKQFFQIVTQLQKSFVENIITRRPISSAMALSCGRYKGFLPSFIQLSHILLSARHVCQVLTRKQPFAGCNFMRVTLEVLEGKRPQVPADCPQAYSKLMRRCWHPQPAKRPQMEDVLSRLDSLLLPSADKALSNSNKNNGDMV